MEHAERQVWIGQVLDGRYEILDWRGGGAFGGVFRAVDKQENLEVAVKVLSLRASPDAEMEFDSERELLEALARCENVVALLGHGKHELQLRTPTGVAFPIERPYLILELADATSGRTPRKSRSAGLARSTQVVSGRG